MNKTIITLLTVLFIGLAYFFPMQWDVTTNKMNTLKKSSRDLIQNLHSPLCIEIISNHKDIRATARELVEQFQTLSPNIQFKEVTKPLSFSEKKQLHLEGSHHLRLTYENKTKTFHFKESDWRENTLTHLIYQTLRETEQWIVFLTGHGEPDLQGSKETDTRQLSQLLKNRGLQVISWNLIKMETIPSNTKILVLNDPKTPLLTQEIEKIQAFLEQGGNLLWLQSAESHPSNKLCEILGIQWGHHIVQDPKNHALGTPHPAISLIHEYPNHPITQLNALTVLPFAIPLQATQAKDRGWSVEPFLQTHDSTYLENESPENAQSQTLGLSLTKGQQRVVLIGNSYFVSNSTILNYGNRELINRVFDWLNQDDSLLSDQSGTLVDIHFTPKFWSDWTIRYLFPYVLPLIILFIGFLPNFRHLLRSFKPTTI